MKRIENSTQLSNNKKTTSELGQHYENLGLKFLQAKGLKLLSRNFTSKMGEIDLILKENNNIIFVEVRFRQSNRIGWIA